MSLFFSYRSVLYHLCPSHTPLPYILLPQPHPGVWALSAWVSDIDTASTSLLFQSFYLRLSCTVQIFLLLSDSYQSLPLLSFLPPYVPSFLVLHSFLLISTPFTPPPCITSSLMSAPFRDGSWYTDGEFEGNQRKQRCCRVHSTGCSDQ